MQKPRPLLFASLLALLSCSQVGLSQGGVKPEPATQPSTLVERGSPLQVVEPDADDRQLRLSPVVRAVQRAADSVVSIYLETRVDRRGPIPEAQGSGVLLDESGLIITNWHVIAPVLLGERIGRTYTVSVKLRDGRQRAARLLSSSPTRDLALLQLEVQGDERFQPIEIGRSADLMIGETVIAIGNPQGQANTVTSGVLSAIDRAITVRAPDGMLREYTGLLQTDAAINQGNSGGALLDITGRLVGINNAMAANAENIGFAIPMDAVRQEFQRDLLQSASFVASGEAPWLGIEVADRDGAVMVSEVVSGGPAALAGVQPGDILRKIADREVLSSIDYLRHFIDVPTGRRVPLLVERKQKLLSIDARPIARDDGTILTAIGCTIDEVDIDRDPELVKATTLAFYRGSGLRRVSLFPAVLRLAEILPDSPAAAIGLQRDDIVLGVFARGPFGDREVPLTSRVDLARLLQQETGKSLRISILRGDRDLAGTIEVRGPRRGGDR